jgi:hypothetical protein
MFGKPNLNEGGDLVSEVIGPIDWFQGTYLNMLRCGKRDVDHGDAYELNLFEDTVLLDGIYYGDFTLMGKCPKYARGKVVTFKQAIEKGWFTKFN